MPAIKRKLLITSVHFACSVIHCPLTIWLPLAYCCSVSLLTYYKSKKQISWAYTQSYLQAQDLPAPLYLDALTLCVFWSLSVGFLYQTYPYRHSCYHCCCSACISLVIFTNNRSPDIISSAARVTQNHEHKRVSPTLYFPWESLRVSRSLIFI